MSSMEEGEENAEGECEETTEFSESAALHREEGTSGHETEEDVSEREGRGGLEEQDSLNAEDAVEAEVLDSEGEDSEGEDAGPRIVRARVRSDSEMGMTRERR